MPQQSPLVTIGVEDEGIWVDGLNQGLASDVSWTSGFGNDC